MNKEWKNTLLKNQVKEVKYHRAEGLISEEKIRNNVKEMNNSLDRLSDLLEKKRKKIALQRIKLIVVTEENKKLEEQYTLLKENLLNSGVVRAEELRQTDIKHGLCFQGSASLNRSENTKGKESIFSSSPNHVFNLLSEESSEASEPSPTPFVPIPPPPPPLPKL
ncbi:hypothetical protein QYM36_012882 [Artemia franciscana]|uniref:Uncharacterized protein n=1 Tax=Artemia franciscana TaxID=6661 RepID=A0AA88HW07_ARTSF|nr:hypothetical protein QYM36_012882 [Artemia franciscana]